MGAVHIRHDRTAQADCAWTRGRPARTSQDTRASHGSGRERQVLLVHDDGMDDVEFSHWGPADRCDGPAFRRRPILSRPQPPVELCPGHRHDVLRDERAFHSWLYEGGTKAQQIVRPCGDTGNRLYGSASFAGRVRVGLRERERQYATWLIQRRHGRVHGLRGAVTAPASARRGDPVSMPGR